MQQKHFKKLPLLQLFHFPQSSPHMVDIAATEAS